MSARTHQFPKLVKRDRRLLQKGANVRLPLSCAGGVAAAVHTTALTAAPHRQGDVGGRAGSCREAAADGSANGLSSLVADDEGRGYNQRIYRLSLSVQWWM